jgi:HAD superfamily hydrolase (TIGR01459 family)
MQQWEPHGSPGGGSVMQIRGLADIASQFDAMLIDQFGVIHDGQSLYPGTYEALFQLRSRRIPVVVMTNSGKRAAANRDRLRKIGLPRDFFDDAVSSGEVAYQQLDLSQRIFVIGKHGDDYGLTGATLVNNLADADVILILGSNAPDTSLEDYEAMLKGCKLPAICCNPDKQMITPHGLLSAPGAIASLYETLGGKVTWIGKPYPGIYRHALEILNRPKRVLCIGDSAEHDVAGGRAAGLKTLLVMQGVSAGVPEDKLEPRPDYVMRDFIW